MATKKDSARGQETGVHSATSGRKGECIGQGPPEKQTNRISVCLSIYLSIYLSIHIYRNWLLQLQRTEVPQAATCKLENQES